MSKTIAAFMVTLGLLVPAASFAQATSTSSGGPNPENVENIWGGTNNSVPHVQPGQSAKDQWGNSFLCPSWYSNYCVDLTHTAYYISNHR